MISLLADRTRVCTCFRGWRTSWELAWQWSMAGDERLGGTEGRQWEWHETLCSLGSQVPTFCSFIFPPYVNTFNALFTNDFIISLSRPPFSPLISLSLYLSTPSPFLHLSLSPLPFSPISSSFFPPVYIIK